MNLRPYKTLDDFSFRQLMQISDIGNKTFHFRFQVFLEYLIRRVKLIFKKKG